MKFGLATIVTITAVALYSQQATATLLLSEDFTGTGNTTGLQYTDPGTNKTIGGLDANGGRREAGSTQFYNLSSSVNTGTVYFSALFSQPVANNWGGFSFYDGGSEKLFFGNAGIPFVGPFSIDQNGGGPPGANQSSVSISNAQTYLMVGAYDFTTGMASLWIDPAFGGAMPAADLTVNYATGWTLTQVRTGSGTTTDFDRLRVGTTFADVTVPEPATLGLFGLGLAGLGLAARRRKSA